MRGRGVEADDRAVVEEEPQGRLVEVPHIERVGEHQLGAKAHLDGAVDAPCGSGEREEAQRSRPKDVWPFDAEDAAKHVHHHRPSGAEVNGQDHEQPVGGEHMGLADGERSVQGQEWKQIARDQRTGDQHDRHRRGKACDGDRVQQPRTVAQIPRAVQVPSPVEDVVDDHEREECGAEQFMRQIAEPPVGEAQDDKSKAHKVENEADPQRHVTRTRNAGCR